VAAPFDGHEYAVSEKLLFCDKQTGKSIYGVSVSVSKQFTPNSATACDKCTKVVHHNGFRDFEIAITTFFYR
jgi:hypothetical protein